MTLLSHSLPLIAVCSFVLIESKLVQHTLNITWAKGSPDGNSRDLIMTNGEMPGPDLIFDEGDEVEIIANNFMPYNTSIHWHGLQQQGTPWSDGVPGLTQKPIQPGSSYTYKFTASPPGTYWYHSHSRMLLQDGQLGALFVRPKPHTRTPFHMISNTTAGIKAMEKAAANPRLITLQDWSFLTSEQFYQAQVDTRMDLFCSDSILVNGKGAVHCPGIDYINRLVGFRLGPVLEGTNLTDKGCIGAELFNIEGAYINDTDPSKKPPGMYDGCEATTGQMAVVKVNKEGDWASLNFIGSQSMKILVVSIDSHSMWVFEADGQFIEPKLVQAFSIYNGQRYAAMVKLDQKPGNYTIRVADNGGDQVISGYATLSYCDGGHVGNSSQYIDYGGYNTSASVRQIDLDPLAPFDVPPPARSSHSTYFTEIKRLGSSYQWTLSGHELYQPDRDDDKPLLYYPKSLDAMEKDLIIRTSNGAWVDIVLQTVFAGNATPINPFQPPHPIHKHSNKAYVIGRGFGMFNWSSAAEAMEVTPDSFNLENPPYTDTFVTSAVALQWQVIRYQVVNPGPFMMHCHISTHFQSGMAMAIMDGTDAWPEIPPEYRLGTEQDSG